MFLNNLYKVLNIIDRFFIFFVVLIFSLVFWLNYDSSLMSGILPAYIEFKNIILSGFSSDYIATTENPTFPMWGYGWVLLITENRFLIFLFQSLIAIWSLFFLIKVLDRYKLFSIIQVKFFKLLVLVAIPFFAINISLTPYGLAISLFIFCFVFFLRGYYEKNLREWFIAGLFLGLVLNFRSDFIYYPLLLILIFIFLKQYKNLIQFIFTFIIGMYIVMIPWGIYTKKVTGHYLSSSTNSGHVFYIGLGQLPNNKWGIEPHDGDPKMHEEIKNYFGFSKSSLVYETDIFLKKIFIEEIKKYPIEYIKKNIVAFKKSIFDGAYSGEFFLKGYKDKEEGREKYISWKNNISLSNFMEALLNSEFQYIVHIIVMLVSSFIKLLSFVLIPITIYFGIKNRDFFVLIVISIIVYQSLILVFAFNMSLYSTNVFLFHIINIILGITYLKKTIKYKYE